MPRTYETDGAAIYRQSFATIRAEADLDEDEDRQGSGDQQGGTGDDLRRTVADHAAKKPGDGGGQQRKQDDELDGEIHGAFAPSPSSR